MHPQLGAVEIGGWDKMNYWRNPPPHLREREAARFPAWMTQIALSLPKLELLRTEVRALGADTWRVRFAVANSGWLPAYVTKRALERKTVRGVMFEIHLPETTGVRWSAASRASRGRSSRATRRRARCRPSCRTARSPPTAPSPSGWCARRGARGSAERARRSRRRRAHRSRTRLTVS